MLRSHALVCRAGIGALTNLRELRVSGNKLSSLSAEVGSLRKLHRLIADGNLLTSIPGKGVAACIIPRNGWQRIGAAHQGCVQCVDHQLYASIQQESQLLWWLNACKIT